MATIKTTRFHDFSYGHRVFGHEGKCIHLHGHNGRAIFTIAANSENDKLDDLGRVIDFSMIKSILCQWLEDNWDHRFLIWEDDPLREALVKLDPTVVWTSFNPTAENMAKYLVEHIAPALLPLHLHLIECTIEETRKCSATYSIE